MFFLLLYFPFLSSVVGKKKILLPIGLLFQGKIRRKMVCMYEFYTELKTKIKNKLTYQCMHFMQLI